MQKAEAEGLMPDDVKRGWKVWVDLTLLETTGWRACNDQELMKDGALSAKTWNSQCLDSALRPSICHDWRVCKDEKLWVSPSHIFSLGNLLLIHSHGWTMSYCLGHRRTWRIRHVVESYPICSYIIDSACVWYALPRLLHILTKSVWRAGKTLNFE